MIAPVQVVAKRIREYLRWTTRDHVRVGAGHRGRCDRRLQFPVLRTPVESENIPDG